MALITRKKLISVVVAAAVLLVSGVYHFRQLVAIGAAYESKILCSGIFISKRDSRDILREDLEKPFRAMNVQIDREAETIAVSFPWGPVERAAYRDCLGCTLLAGYSYEEIVKSASTVSCLPSASPVDMLFRPGRTDGKVLREVDLQRLESAVEKAFKEKDESRPARTRAVVVVFKGAVIAEGYARGFSAKTVLPAWSMAKSVVNALVGILVKEGKLSVDKRAPIAEWSGTDDPRKAITLDNLLRMSSGLQFDDRSGPVVSDVNRMLLLSPDVASYAVNKPLLYAPGTHWKYSNGTTNIISRIIRNTFEGDDAAYHAFPRTALFGKIGMTGAVLEVDASGTFVGSSFLYATARDWARFGQLYLQDGVWNGERILPEGWVTYTTTPSPAAPLGRYGAHFWTNGGKGREDGERPFPKLPPDIYYASGYEGQYVVIIPSHRMVIVRLGMTKNADGWDMESFVSGVIQAVFGKDRQ